MTAENEHFIDIVTGLRRRESDNFSQQAAEMLGPSGFAAVQALMRTATEDTKPVTFEGLNDAARSRLDSAVQEVKTGKFNYLEEFFEIQGKQGHYTAWLMQALAIMNHPDYADEARAALQRYVGWLRAGTVLFLMMDADRCRPFV